MAKKERTGQKHRGQHIFQARKRLSIKHTDLLVYLCDPITHDLLIPFYFLVSLSRLPRVLRPQLIISPHRNILRSEITVEILQHDFDDVTAHEVNDHKTRHDDFEFRAEGHELQLLVDLRDKLRRTRESYARYENETPIHAAVLADTLSEWATLIIDSEGRDLLDELKQVDGAVEEGGLEFAF